MARPRDDVVLAVTLRLPQGDTGSCVPWPMNTPPTARPRNRPAPARGSTFANPAGDFAGRLIEAAGLKGFAIGPVSFSTKHTNFIINAGGGTAVQVRELIDHARHAVVRTDSASRFTPRSNYERRESRDRVTDPDSAKINVTGSLWRAIGRARCLPALGPNGDWRARSGQIRGPPGRHHPRGRLDRDWATDGALTADSPLFQIGDGTVPAELRSTVESGLPALARDRRCRLSGSARTDGRGRHDPGHARTGRDPYVGSGVLGSAVAMDKAMAKLVLSQAGIPQAKWAIDQRRSNGTRMRARSLQSVVIRSRFALLRQAGQYGLKRRCDQSAR